MASKTQQRIQRRKLYDWHAWVGFQLAVIMFVILSTGTIATVSNEIDWMIFDEMRTFNQPAEPEALTAHDWQQMYQAVRDYAPTARVQSLSSMGHDYFTYRARVRYPDGDSRFVHVDQWTNTVTGDIPLLTVQRFFRDFHRYLFMPSVPGLPIVTFFAFVLALSLYTGLKTTRNWKTALWRLRTGQGIRILLSDLHKVFGLWGLWFMAIIIVTSWWYLFEFGAGVAGQRLEPPAPKVAPQAGYAAGNIVSPAQLQQGYLRASTTLPDWQITAVQLPFSDTGILRFKGVGNNPLLRDRAFKVDLHPGTLTLLGTQHPPSMSWGNYLNEYADPLHFGYWGGLASKLVWFVFGLGLTGLSVTGVLMTWKRTRSQALTRTQLKTLPLLGLALVYFVFWLGRYT